MNCLYTTYNRCLFTFVLHIHVFKTRDSLTSLFSTKYTMTPGFQGSVYHVVNSTTLCLHEEPNDEGTCYSPLVPSGCDWSPGLSCYHWLQRHMAQQTRRGIWWNQEIHRDNDGAGLTHFRKEVKGNLCRQWDNCLWRESHSISPFPQRSRRVCPSVNGYI